MGHTKHWKAKIASAICSHETHKAACSRSARVAAHSSQQNHTRTATIGTKEDSLISYDFHAHGRIMYRRKGKGQVSQCCGAL